MKIKGQANIGTQGFFKIEAHQQDDEGNVIPGTTRLLADWFENLMTDGGMEMLKAESGGFLKYLRVGTGSTAPAKSDTTLEALVAKANTDIVKGPNDFSPVDYPWCSANVSVQFGKGVAAGNLSEVGVGTFDALFARALIKDTNGNPTTITVLPIEFLTVTYQWRVYYDLTYTHQQTFTIDSVAYTVDVMTGALDDALAFNWGKDPYGGFLGNSAPGGSIYLKAFNGAIGAPGTIPSGTEDRIDNGVSSAGATGNPYIDVSYHAEIDKWNMDISAICGYVVGPKSLKMGFTPALPKDNTKEIDITIRYSWGRKVP